MKALRSLFDGELPAAVLFDLDGTLVDSVPDLAAAIDLSLGDVNLLIAGVDNVRDWVGNGAQVLVQRAVNHAQSLNAESILSSGEVDSAELEKLAYQRFLYHYGNLPDDVQRSKLYDGVLALLKALKNQGVLIALVTNKPTQFTPTILEKFSIDDFFDVVVCGDTLAEKKPSPEPLLFAALQLAVPVHSCVMIGDSKNDIQAAKQADMPSVSVAWGYNHGEDAALLGADLHVRSFGELL